MTDTDTRPRMALAAPEWHHGLAPLLQLVPHPWPPAVASAPATVAAYLVDAADTLADVGSGPTHRAHRAREHPTPARARDCVFRDLAGWMEWRGVHLWRAGASNHT